MKNCLLFKLTPFLFFFKHTPILVAFFSLYKFIMSYNYRPTHQSPFSQAPYPPLNQNYPFNIQIRHQVYSQPPPCNILFQ